MTTISKQIAELQTSPAAELADRYDALFGKPPRVRNVAWLRRQLAWKLQEQAFGSLSPRAKSRLDELVAQIDLPLRDAAPAPTRRTVPPPRADANAPMVGTTLVREWHGQQIRVEVRDSGFEWNGVLYKSLSACAKAITGASWNGRLFFGLTSRRSAS